MRSIRGRFVCRAWKFWPLPGCYLGWYLYRFWTSSTNMSLRRPEMALNAKIRKGVAPIVGVDCGRAVRPNEVLCECWMENLDAALAASRATKTECLCQSNLHPALAAAEDLAAQIQMTQPTFPSVASTALAESSLDKTKLSTIRALLLSF